MSLWEMYKAKRLGYADDLWTSLIGHRLGGYSWISTDYEQTPYIYRAMPNMSHYYNREIMEEVVGGTVAWNQLARNPNFDSTEDWGGRFSVVSVANNIATVTPTSEGTQRGLLQNTDKVVRNSQISHRYYISADVKPPINCVVEMSFGGGGAKTRTIVGDTWNHVSCIYSPPDNGYTYEEKVALYIRDSLTTSQEIQYKNIEVHDLTQMFGSTVADYIYSLEQATAGAGVAWFKKYFPKPYYAYNAGELKSVKGLVSHDMVGFNAWDEEWELGQYDSSGEKTIGTTRIRSKNRIPILPNTSYYFKSPKTLIVSYYDADGNFIAPQVNTGTPLLTTPSNAYYCTFYVYETGNTTYNNDICINLSWDGSRDGEYEPYQKWSYPLDSDLELRGIPKLDNGKLYYDGDEYESDGTVTRKYGIVDLGTLTWSKNGGENVYYATVSRGKNQDDINALTNAPYTYIPRAQTSSDKIFKIVASGFDAPTAYFRNDTVSTVADFVNTVNGKYLVYELTTPTTETAQPFTKTQKCDSGGTEEFVTSGIVSVGHKSKYAEK